MVPRYVVAKADSTIHGEIFPGAWLPNSCIKHSRLDILFDIVDKAMVLNKKIKQIAGKLKGRRT